MSINIREGLYDGLKEKHMFLKRKKVAPDEATEKVYFPTSSDQNSVLFEIYKTDFNDVEYPDHPSLKMIGELETKESQTYLEKTRGFRLQMFFGESVLKCSVVDSFTQETSEVEVSIAGIAVTTRK
jgi:hypothetical protein